MNKKATSLMFAGLFVCGVVQIKSMDIDLLLIADNMPKHAIRDTYGFSQTRNVVIDAFRNNPKNGGPTEAQRQEAARDAYHGTQPHVKLANELVARCGDNLMVAVVEGKLGSPVVSRESNFGSQDPRGDRGAPNNVHGSCEFSWSRNSYGNTVSISRSSRTGGYCGESSGIRVFGTLAGSDGGSYGSSDFMGHD